MGLQSAPLSDLPTQVRNADIILVATNSPEPTILKSHLEGGEKKLIIDLSIPYNVEEGVCELPNVRLVNVDELSKLKDETLKKRKAEVPKAKVIINELKEEFMEWHEMRRHVPLLKAAKLKLKEIHNHPLSITSNCCAKEAELRIQRVINDMASRIRVQNQGACHYIEAINSFMTAGARN